MEKFTFSEPAVARKSSRFLLVRADVTKNTPADRALLKRFRLFGPPGIIFFDAQGKPLNDARVVGFKNAAQFSAVLDSVLAPGAKQQRVTRVIPALSPFFEQCGRVHGEIDRTNAV